MKIEKSFSYIFRFGMMPLMLFSGTFFPLSQLPGGLRAVAYATPLWHGVALCRALSLGTRPVTRSGCSATPPTWPCWPPSGSGPGPAPTEGGSMSSATLRMLPPAGLLARLRRAGTDTGSLRLIERHARAYGRAWLVFVSGVFEPLFYLLSVGLGLGVLVGKVPGPGGQLIPYREFVAPGLLAVSSMNGAMYDSTFNVFFRLKYAKLYDAVSPPR